MLTIYKKIIVSKLILSLVLVSSSVLADIEPKAVNMKFIQKKLNLPAILQLQREMKMSATPKQLSEQPTATCFQANIDDYLLKKSTEDKKVYGCIFSDQVAMNAALLRAGLYVHTDMGMASDAQLFNSKLMTAVGGHDFLGSELVKFHQNAVVPTESATEHKQLKDIEQQFKKEILDKIIHNHKDNFIFFAVINTKKFRANITHELIHAQYYSVPEIAGILLKVWETKVKPRDQKTIMDALQKGGYDMKQQELLLREFYSYFLQYNAVEYVKSIKVLADISPLIHIYAPEISKALKQHNIKLITIGSS